MINWQRKEWQPATIKFVDSINFPLQCKLFWHLDFLLTLDDALMTLMIQQWPPTDVHDASKIIYWFETPGQTYPQRIRFATSIRFAVIEAVDGVLPLQLNIKPTGCWQPVGLSRSATSTLAGEHV